MKEDRTHYTCDRCRKTQTQPLGDGPEPYWWHLDIDVLRRLSYAAMAHTGREVLLCTDCANEIERWLRDPKTKVERIADHVQVWKEAAFGPSMAEPAS